MKNDRKNKAVLKKKIMAGVLAGVLVFTTIGTFIASLFM